jgi:HK97 family phage major capsid protein
MLKPHELRARAAQLRAEAQGIYDTVKGDATGRDFTDDELKAYDAKLDEAEGLLKRADADEAREARLGKLTADLAARPAPAPGGRQSDPLPHQDAANARDHDGNPRRYSLMKALRQALAAREGTGRLDGLELEVHEEMLKRRGDRPALGVLVPWELPVDHGAARRFARQAGMERRDLTTSTGGGAAFTAVSATMIEYLRNMTLADRLGVRTMNDMRGSFSIPRQTGTGTAYWVTEGNAPTESNQTIGGVTFTPRTVGAFSDYSRKFLMQTSVDAEAFVREDLMQVLAVEVVRVTFFGSGSGAEPTGVSNAAGVTVVPLGTNGAALTWANLVQMETAAATANALLDNLAYVTNPKVRGAMKQTTQVAASTFAQWLWNPDNTANGYPVYASNQIPSNLTKGTGTALSALLFGAWNQAIWAFWSGIDVLVDPYTGGTAGNVRVIELQDADFQLRQPSAFSVAKDVIAA